MANSTTMITDIGTVITNNNVAVKAATAANALNATAVTVAAGAAGNYTGGTGSFGAGTGPFYGGMMDYLGHLELLKLKMKETAALLERVLANTDQATDGTNQTLLVNILNNYQ